MGQTDKSKHYTSAQNYKDLDGLSKSFTMIDHDKKLKISKLIQSDKELEDIKNQLKNYRDDLYIRVLSVPASLCPDSYYDFTVRGADSTLITWNEKMIKDEGLSIDRLRTLVVILENTIELHRIII